MEDKTQKMKRWEMSKFKSTVTDLKPRKKTKSAGGFEKYLIDKKAYIEEIKAYLHFEKPNEDNWRGIIAVPPGSGLDHVIEAFKISTDVPLELPLFTYLHHVSGYLLKQGVTYGSASLGSGHIPFIWNIVLADSGAGKTFTVDKIAKYSAVKSNFPEVASGAKFFEEVKDKLENDGFVLWFLDECAQFLKGCQQIGHPLFEVKNYLLKIYSQGLITRSTKKAGNLEIDKPVMSILGMNTIESFLKCIDEESMTDGFCQRFGYVIGKFDPERQPVDFPIYDSKEMDTDLSKSFTDIDQLDLTGAEFVFKDDAELLFRLGFQKLFTGKVPVSFYRRNLFRSFSYAVIYHVLLGKTSKEIDTEDMAWGLRVTELHLNDMITILKKDGLNDVQKKVKQAKEMAKRLEVKGRKIRPSDLAKNYRDLDTEQATVILKMAGLLDND